MQKYKAKKEVIEQVTSKLNETQNRENKGNLGGIPSVFDDSINLPPSNNNFNFIISDITQNNKAQKLKQVEKALEAKANNVPFIIKHIEQDESEKYRNVLLRVKDFSLPEINKAINKTTFVLGEKSKAAKGEQFVYKAQEDLTNLIVGEFSEKTHDWYTFVTDYFGLPEMRAVSKSLLRHKGKIIYNPDTGEPISKKDWMDFVKAMDNFLNRNYKGVGERIIIKSSHLGKLLNKLVKIKGFTEARKVKLEDIKDIDWISDDIRKLTSRQGDSLTRTEQARIAMYLDGAAQRVKSVTEAERNRIQQVLIDGVLERRSKSQVAQDLFNSFTYMNRDFQRIADTEIQNASTRAYIKEEMQGVKEGQKVYFRRIEVIDGRTCPECRKINGTIALWSDTALPNEKIKDDIATVAIWEGKTDGIPLGCKHPYCRGSWIRED